MPEKNAVRDDSGKDERTSLEYADESGWPWPCVTWQDGDADNEKSCAVPHGVSLNDAMRVRQLKLVVVA